MRGQGMGMAHRIGGSRPFRNGNRIMPGDPLHGWAEVSRALDNQLSVLTVPFVPSLLVGGCT